MSERGAVALHARGALTPSDSTCDGEKFHSSSDHDMASHDSVAAANPGCVQIISSLSC